ncbi:MAG: tetratricopeptide repeat protein [Desulfobacter sp.]|nr:MAG: tetratricopeptide repeat protein [Desulfobacter sp.]
MDKNYIYGLASIYSRLNEKIASLELDKDGNFCGTCVQCCHHRYRFPVSSMEIDYILHHHEGLDFQDAFIDYINGRLKGSGGTPARCPYSSEAGCLIYEARPMCCRIYGFAPYRPLLAGCSYIGIREETKKIWRTLVPIFNEFIGFRNSFFARSLEAFTPKTITDFLDRGILFLAASTPEKALAEFRGALDLNPDDPLVHACMGEYHEAIGEIETALDRYRHSLVLDSYDYATHLKIGLILQKQEQFEAAFDHYKKALDIDPYNAGAWGNIGQIYAASGRMRDARDAYQWAISFDPANPVYHMCLGSVFYAENDPEQTIVHMERALALSPAEDMASFCQSCIAESKKNIQSCK